VRASCELTSIQPLEFIALRQDVLDSSGMERKEAAASLRIPAPERRSVRSPAWTYPPPGSWKCILSSPIASIPLKNQSLTAAALS
jgi:hypothetical protein